MSVLDATWLALIAFTWGEWWGQRKHKPNDDPAFKLLFGMIQAVREKRRFVGPALQIIRQEKFEFFGDRYTLSLTSDGNPVTIDGETL